MPWHRHPRPLDKAATDRRASPTRGRRQDHRRDLQRVPRRPVPATFGPRRMVAGVRLFRHYNRHATRRSLATRWKDIDLAKRTARVAGAGDKCHRTRTKPFHPRPSTEYSAYAARQTSLLSLGRERKDLVPHVGRNPGRRRNRRPRPNPLPRPQRLRGDALRGRGTMGGPENARPRINRH